MHAQDDVVDLATLLVKGATQGKRPGDVRSVAAVLGCCVEEEVRLAVEVGVVFHVVERRGVGAGGDDGGIGLVFGPVGETSLEEYGCQFALVANVFGGVEDGGVGNGGDGIGFADEGDFVGVFDDAAFFDGGFEEGAVSVGE